MRDFAFGPWTIQSDVAATRRCYEHCKHGGTEACGCPNCTNFALVRELAYPLELLALFDSLGIDFKKEHEVHHYRRTPAGLHIYRGWFYVVGSVAQGPDSWIRQQDGKWERRFHRVNPTFEVGFTQIFREGFTKRENVPEGFRRGPCIEIDFYTDLPWRSDQRLEPK